MTKTASKCSERNLLCKHITSSSQIHRLSSSKKIIQRIKVLKGARLKIRFYFWIYEESTYDIRGTHLKLNITIFINIYKITLVKINIIVQCCLQICQQIYVMSVNVVYKIDFKFVSIHTRTYLCRITH